MRIAPALALAPLLLLAGPPPAASARTTRIFEARARLVEGVREIARPGVPGPVALVGEDAFAVVAAPAGQGVRQAVVAAAFAGRGRIVAFGHGGYVGAGAGRSGHTARLLRNAVRWAAGDAEKVRVGLAGHADLIPRLAGEGVEIVPLPARAWREGAENADVLVLDDPGAGGSEGEKALHTVLQRGGGLVTAGLARGWMQLNPSKDLREDHALNRVLAAYRDLPKAERPANDAEKRDPWLVRLSRQEGRNLGPYFEAWGVPTSKAARAAVADLDAWTPDLSLLEE